MTWLIVQADKAEAGGDRAAGSLSRAEGSLLYPLGFDDPSGLQSQQSLALFSALTAKPLDSFSQALDAELKPQEDTGRPSCGNVYNKISSDFSLSFCNTCQPLQNMFLYLLMVMVPPNRDYASDG